MKYYLLVAGLLSLSACGGSSDTSTSRPGAQAEQASDADPRIAQIRDLHQQLVAIQKPLETTEKNPIMRGNQGMTERHKEYLDMVTASEGILGTINQLDASKQDATQAALVGESLRREQAMLTRAKSLVALNQDWIDYIQKSKTH